MIHAVYFSATGTTEQVVGAIAEALGGERWTYDLAHASGGTVEIDTPDDLVIFGTPVYAGRGPAWAAEQLAKVQGKGQPAIAVCVYGNRDYDDALVELCDLVEAQGFRLVGAGAFIAEHCIFPKVAQARPDAADRAKIRIFAELCAARIAGLESFDKSRVKGNRPYRKPAGVPIHPRTDRSRCRECGVCVQECPTGAIDAAKPYLTDSSKCISCCRCIKVCRQNARRFGGLLYRIAGWKFCKDNARRREPEWF